MHGVPIPRWVGVSLAACVLIAAGGSAAVAQVDPAPPPELLPPPVLSADTRISCFSGPTFPASGLDAPTGAEHGSGPAYRALRAALKRYRHDRPESARWTWRMVGREPGWALFLPDIPFTENDRIVALEVVEDLAFGWTSSVSEGCRLYVSLGEGINPAEWALDPDRPAPTASDTVLHLLVWGLGCDSGSLTTGRNVAPLVEYGDDTLTITMGVLPPVSNGGGHTCQGSIGTPVTLTLPEPLGDRTLLDGGPYRAGPPVGPQPFWPVVLPSPAPSPSAAPA